MKEHVRGFSSVEEENNRFNALRHRLAEAPRRHLPTEPRTVRIHNTEHDLEVTRAAVSRFRNLLWHWTKKTWQPQDIVVRRSDGRISFDLSLAADTANFQLVQNGWNHDLCSICGWKLYVAPEPEVLNWLHERKDLGVPGVLPEVSGGHRLLRHCASRNHVSF